MRVKQREQVLMTVKSAALLNQLALTFRVRRNNVHDYLLEKEPEEAPFTPGNESEYTEPWLDFSPEKTTIFYHRSYRKVESRSMPYIALSVLLLVVLVEAFILYYFPELTRILSQAAATVLGTCVPAELVQITRKQYLFDYVYVVSIPGRYPSITLSVITAIISLTVIYLSVSVKRAIDPKLVWLIFISFILLFSAIFFIFFPEHFPYDLAFFSEMYIKTEVGIWMTIPFILTFALLPFPFRLVEKFGVILLTLAYSIVFACVRYIVFLYLLRSTTYLFMALMFFMLGPFLDFIYIVGSYSLCLSESGKRIGKDKGQWNWLY